MHFYDLSAKQVDGKTIDFKSLKNKVVLVVNTATKCGLANQFDGLEKLYDTYKDKGFTVLAFPSNQFNNQEPGDNAHVESTCRGLFGVQFPIFEKVDVFGQNQHEVFKYLTEKKPGLFGKKIKWNFTKFLIDTNGTIIKRFSPTTKPEKIESYIKKLI